MATVNPLLQAPEEHAGPAAEDALNVPAARPQAEMTEPTETSPDTLAAPEKTLSAGEQAPRARRPRIKAESVGAAEAAAEETEELPEVDFSEEDAALAARDAGLEIEGETVEESEAEAQPAAETFAGKTKEELLALFARLLSERPVQSIRREVEALKIAFYRIRRAEVEAVRRAFVESGEPEESFEAPVDGLETRFKELFKDYRARRDEFIANLEAEKENNLRTKLAIIEELKELVSSDETLNHTFARFRDLQARWKETGIVPQLSLIHI